MTILTVTTIIAKNTTVEVRPSAAVVQVIPQKTAIAIFPNASFSGSGQSRIKIPFSWGDATPKTIVSLTGFIKRASCSILVPFDASSLLSLGDSLVSDRLIKSSQINPSAIAEFETSPLIQYASSTEIKLAIAAGVGCSTGSGFIILEV